MSAPDSIKASEPGDQAAGGADDPPAQPGGDDESASPAAATTEEAAPALTPVVAATAGSARDKGETAAKDETAPTDEILATADSTATAGRESSPATPAAAVETGAAAEPEATAEPADVTAEPADVTEPEPTAVTEPEIEPAAEIDPPASTAARSALATRSASTEKTGGFSSLFTWVQRAFFNRTPTVTFDPASLIRRADGSVTGAVIGYDGDDDVLTYAASQPGNAGTVTINNNGSFAYTPAQAIADASPVTFDITVSDDNNANGWHLHGLLGLLIAGWGSTSTTAVSIGRSTSPTGSSTSSSAGSRYNWGTPRETLFNSLQSLSDGGWQIYNSPGHHGFGRRTPAAISFADGIMTITGDAAGNTGGLAWYGNGQKYGAWEVRARVPEGAADYHAVALLWPDAENWPVGGEVDFVEILGDASRQHATHTLHYSAQNRIDSATTQVDATQWHNYAVSWTPQAITVYIDAVPVWQTTDTSQFPPGPMHLGLQLDASEKRPLDLGGGAQMQVAWARQYTLDQIT